MRKRLSLLSLVLLGAVSLILYFDWAIERSGGPLLSDLRPLALHSHGEPGTAGNLLGLATRLTAADYQHPDRLRLKFATHLEQAREAGLLNARTVVILPEHVGTGLFALDEKLEVLQARTLRDAMQWMALSNPWRYLQALLANRGEDRRTEAVLRMKAQSMAEAYQTIFGQLARNHGLTLVAGSIVLPEPRLEQGRLLPGDGPLRQVSLVFDPQGRIIAPIVYKQALSRYERRYSSAPANPPRLPQATAAGALQVQLGCDAHLRMPAEGSELLALPGECPGTPRGAPPSELPRMAVPALAIPWNLLGSPHRPAATDAGNPGRMLNLWLEDRAPANPLPTPSRQGATDEG